MGHYDEQYEMDRQARAARASMGEPRTGSTKPQPKVEEPKAGDMRINAQGELEAWVQSMGWIPASETQWSISMWKEKTFGPMRNFSSEVIRANLEFGELLRACDALDNAVRAGKLTDKLKAAVAEEGADVFISLMNMFTVLGVDYKNEINKKMMVNRQRKWVLDGNGSGQHIRETRDHSRAVAGVVTPDYPSS